MKKEKWDDIFCWLTLGLIPVHLYLSFTNILYGIDKGAGHSYPARSYVLLGVYLLVMAAALAYMVGRKTFGIAKGWKIYWLSAGVALVVAAMILWLAPAFAENNLLVVLPALYAPCMVLRPLLEVFGIEVDLSMLCITAAFCFLCWGVCQLFVKKEK